MITNSSNSTIYFFIYIFYFARTLAPISDTPLFYFLFYFFIFVLYVALWDILVMRWVKGVSPFVCWNRHEGIYTFKNRPSVCGRRESLIVIAALPNRAVKSPSDGPFPSMPVSEQSRPGVVKAHGKARPAHHSSRMWLRKERSVSVLPLWSLSLGRAAGRGRRANGKRPGVRSHGRRSQHRHCSNAVNAFWTRPPSSSDTALFLPSASVFFLCFFLLQSLPPFHLKSHFYHLCHNCLNTLLLYFCF